jgi:hypothetical protein
MWSEMMGFTLFTRAEPLGGIWLVNYDGSKLFHVLQHQTAWQGKKDVWLGRNDVLRRKSLGPHGTTESDLENPMVRAFTEEDAGPFPPIGTIVVHVVQSTSKRVLYVRCT